MGIETRICSFFGVWFYFLEIMPKGMYSSHAIALFGIMILSYDDVYRVILRNGMFHNIWSVVWNFLIHGNILFRQFFGSTTVSHDSLNVRWWNFSNFLWIWLFLGYFYGFKLKLDFKIGKRLTFFGNFMALNGNWHLK